MENYKLTLSLVLVFVFTACGGGENDNFGGGQNLPTNLLDPRALLERQIYHFEHGHEPIGYTALWCDTLYFDPFVFNDDTQGRVYQNDRVASNTTSCTDLVLDPLNEVGTYQILANNVMVVTFPGDQREWKMRIVDSFGTYYHVSLEEIDLITNQSIFEGSRFYINSGEIETALVASEGQFNEEMADMVISWPPNPNEPDDVIDIDVYVNGMTCASVTATYKLYAGHSLSGPALTFSGRSMQTFDVIDLGVPSCTIDFDFTIADGYNSADFVPGDRYYFVAEPINGIYDESIKLSNTVP